MAAVAIRGLREVNRAFRLAGDKEGRAAVKEANGDVGRVVAEEARPNVRRRSGRMAATVRGKGTQRKGVVVMSRPYATTQEYGRKRGNVGSPPGNRKGRNVVKGDLALNKARDAVVARGEAAEQYQRRLLEMFQRLL